MPIERARYLSAAGGPSGDGTPQSEAAETEKLEAGMCSEVLPWERLLAVVSGRPPPAFTAAISEGRVVRSGSSLQCYTSEATCVAGVPLEEMLIVIVPFRSRGRHLRVMLNAIRGYLDALLQHQDAGKQQPEQQHQQGGQLQEEGWPRGKTDYCFIVVEQRDSRSFHKSKETFCGRLHWLSPRLYCP